MSFVSFCLWIYITFGGTGSILLVAAVVVSALLALYRD